MQKSKRLALGALALLGALTVDLPHPGTAAPKKSVAKAKPKKAAPSKKKVLPGGLVVEDLKVGTGAVAKNGQQVTVNYRGKLTNGQIFDESYKRGEPFSFMLGGGQVIKGWDTGVAGMKVGGKRRLTIPPALAYGPNGQPPVIPPSATLIFDVELLKAG